MKILKRAQKRNQYKVSIDKKEWENIGAKTGWLKLTASQSMVRIASFNLKKSYSQLRAFYKKATEQTTTELVSATPDLKQSIFDNLSVYDYDHTFSLWRKDPNQRLTADEAKRVIADALYRSLQRQENKHYLNEVSAYSQAQRKFSMNVGFRDRKFTVSLNGISMPASMIIVFNGEVTSQFVLLPIGNFHVGAEDEEGAPVQPRMRRNLKDAADAFEAVSAAGYIAGNITIACVLQKHKVENAEIKLPQKKLDDLKEKIREALNAGQDIAQLQAEYDRVDQEIRIVRNNLNTQLQSLWKAYGSGYEKLDAKNIKTVAMATSGRVDVPIMRKCLTYFTSITGEDVKMETKNKRTEAGFDILLSRKTELHELVVNLGVRNAFQDLIDTATIENAKTSRRTASVLTMPLTTHKAKILEAVLKNTEIVSKIMDDFGVGRPEAEVAIRDSFEAGFSGEPDIQPDIQPDAQPA